LIKVMNLVAILIAPVIIKPFPLVYRILIVVVSVCLLGLAVYFNNRGRIGVKEWSSK